MSSNNKKNSNRPLNSAGTRPNGSPVEAARKSFVPEASNVGTEVEPTVVAKTSNSAKSRTSAQAQAQAQALSARQTARIERQKKRQRQQIIIWSVGGLVVLAIVAGIVFWQVSQGPKTDANGIQTFGTLSQQHVTGPVTYAQIPPVGGPHNPIWQNCGIYTSPIANENGVHSLEHGAVWITYQPSLPADQIAKLQAMVRGQTYMLLSPYTNLPSPVVASAWSTQLKLTSVDDPRLASFISTYRLGPQTLEPGAACTGGVGTPIG